MHFATTASRLAIGICGAVVGAYCAFTAFRNGQSLAAGIDGIAFGCAFAAVVIGSWFLLPLAAQSPKGRAPLMRVGWALCLAFVLINAVGFTARHRTETVGGRSVAITAYDTALAGLSEARERLAAMKANPRWARTSGCTDATAEQSIGFCRQVQQAQTDITRHQAVITSGRPAAADAQADTIAWATRIDSAVVSRALPIFMAVVLDIAASLFIWAALTTYGQHAAAPAVQEPRTIAEPVAKKTKRKTANQVRKLKQIAIDPTKFFETMPRTKRGKIDKRSKLVRAKNDNVPELA